MTHARLLLGLLLLSATSAWSRQENGSISGIVVRADTQEPLPGVIVQICGQTKTDENGRFVLTNVPPGTYSILALRSGMAKPRHDNSPKTVTVGLGEQVRDVRIQLMPFGTIRGKIVDNDGKPLAGVTVRPLVVAYPGGRRALVTPESPVNDFTQSVPTDANGEYRLDLPPGQYYIRVADERSWRAISSGRLGFVILGGSMPNYYPGTLEEGLAAVVDLKGGDQIPGIDIRYTKQAQAVSKVSGRILTETGSVPDGPISLITLTLPDGLRSLPFSNRVPSPDVFELDGVPHGTYDLEVSTTVNGNRQRGSITIDVRDEKLEGLTVPLRSLSSKNVSGLVSVDGPTGSLPLDPLMVLSGGSHSKVGPDGTFELKDLFEGKRKIEVNGLPPDAYVSDIRQGPRSLYDSAHDLNGPEFNVLSAVEPLEITINTNGGAVSGTVQTSTQQRAARVRVVLVPPVSRRFVQSRYKTTLTDAAGNFTLRGIAPGIYQIFAWESIPESAWLNPEFLAAYENSGTTVPVDRGRHITVRVPLLPAVD